MSDASIKSNKIWAIFRKPWIWFAGFLVALAATLTALNSIAREARDLPGEWGNTAGQFFSWYYEYDEWPGHWASNPEGWADTAQWDLSDEKFHLNIELDDAGKIGGWIESTGICEGVPIFEKLMVDGEVTGSNAAELEVWDLIGGYRREFASLEVERQEFIMVVRPIDDPSGIFQPETRIGRDNDEFLGDDPPHESACAGKRMEFNQGAIEKLRQEPSP